MHPPKRLYIQQSINQCNTGFYNIDIGFKKALQLWVICKNTQLHQHNFCTTKMHTQSLTIPQFPKIGLTHKRQKSKLRLGRHQIISGVFNLHCINSVCRIRNFNIICQPFYHSSKVHYRTKQSKTKHKTKIKVKWRQISGV